jgi:hypothetical protein
VTKSHFTNGALVPAREEGRAQAESVVVLHYRNVAFESISRDWVVNVTHLEQWTIASDSLVTFINVNSLRVIEFSSRVV